MRVGPLDRWMVEPGVYLYETPTGRLAGTARKTDFNKWSTEVVIDDEGGTVCSYSHRTLARCDAEVLAKYNDLIAAGATAPEEETPKVNETYVGELLQENRELSAEVATLKQKIADMDALHRQSSQRAVTALKVSRSALEMQEARMDALRTEQSTLRTDVELLVAAIDGAGLRSLVPVLVRNNYKSEPVAQSARVSLVKEND